MKKQKLRRSGAVIMANLILLLGSYDPRRN